MKSVVFSWWSLAGAGYGRRLSESARTSKKMRGNLLMSVSPKKVGVCGYGRDYRLPNEHCINIFPEKSSDCISIAELCHKPEMFYAPYTYWIVKSIRLQEIWTVLRPSDTPREKARGGAICLLAFGFKPQRKIANYTYASLSTDNGMKAVNVLPPLYFECMDSYRIAVLFNVCFIKKCIHLASCLKEHR